MFILEETSKTRITGIQGHNVQRQLVTGCSNSDREIADTAPEIGQSDFKEDVCHPFGWPCEPIEYTLTH